MQRIPAFLIVLSLASMAACSTTSRQAQVPAGMEFQCDTDEASLFRRLDLATKARESDSLDLLLLSGGGARGAWGAGFLKGWRRGPNKIPDFDVVTGVSTGSLQATHAFLGDFDKLYEIYTTTKEEDIYRKRPLLTALFSNSLLSSEPLGKFVENIVTEDLLRQVEKKSAGRLLCVGAVNLATGMFQEWDLTKIASAWVASDGDSARQDQLLNLYQTVLLGSAAIPLAFPPVEITEDGKSALFVDGGTRQNVFIAFGDVLDAMTTPLSNRQLFGSYAGKRMMNYVPLNNYIIVNGQLGIGPASVENKLVPIAVRSFDALMAQSANGALYQIEYELARREKKGKIKTHYSYIPGEICLSKSALDFDPKAMKTLADEAAKCGDKQKWFKFEPNKSLPACRPNATPCD